MSQVKIERIAGSVDNPSLNVVFLHGLGGGPQDTWTYKVSETDKRFWPAWLLEDVKGLAAYTVGYPADKMGWNKGWPIEEAAVAVSQSLRTEDSLRTSDKTPIVFVCHSLGGIIAKKLILKADRVREVDPATGEFLDRIVGVVFLATPHDGSMLATLVGRLGWLASDTMKDLVANSSKLADLGNDYRNYIAANNGRIRHEVYYEKDSIDGSEFVSSFARKLLGQKAGRIVGSATGKIFGAVIGKAVTSSSANPGLSGPDPVPVGRDHIDICKVVGKDDPVYKGVRIFLEDALKPRPPSTREVVEDTKNAAEAAKANTDVISRQQHADSAKLDELLAFARDSGAAKRAADQGIPEAAIRAIVEKLGGEEISRDKLVEWLDKWTTAAVRELRGGANEGEAFDRAFEKARELFNAGHIAEASQPFMEELEWRRKAEELRHEEEKRANLRLVEEAIKYDKLALNGEAAAAKLRVMADIEGARRPDVLGAYLFGKAKEFYETGDRVGDNAALLVAIAAYREALKERTREHFPLEWATTQNNLGNALFTLGERESGTAKLEEAVAAYREALKERTRERVPLDWATTQNNIGSALSRLGERESGTAKLEEAVAAYREALKERTRERVPLDWATTQNGLGNALLRLGERESGTVKLEEAVAAYREALKVFTRERARVDWAMTQNHLGNALFRLGECERGTTKLEEALVAYREALTETTRERAPLEWAGTQNGLGNALLRLGERESGTAKLEEAVAAYREALKEYTKERVPLDWAMTQGNLGNALLRLGERESGTAKLKEAVAAYREALKERTRERVPRDWAGTQNNLGNALFRLGERESDMSKLAEAIVAYREALKEYTREGEPLRWAATQDNLGNALQALGRLEGGKTKFEEAIAAHREALTERTRERAPRDWAATQNNLGNAFLGLGERESGIAKFEDAVAAYSEALKERTQECNPLDWAMSHGNQGIAMLKIAARKSDAPMAHAALQQIYAAHETMQTGGHLTSADFYKAHLAEGRSICESLAGH